MTDRSPSTYGSRLSLQSAPPGASQALVKLARRATRPIDRFLRIEAASGIVLLVASIVALALANSPWSEPYLGLWKAPITLGVGSLQVQRSLAWFVNDVLMVLFFFVVGMEIRRELHHGELADWRRALLPAAAALGGMIAPAILYLAIAGDPPTRSGWGIPMATDIAFALGVLSLLGDRVPPALRVLLLALAVIDDLGAILVIALFYSSGITVTGIAIGAAGLAAIVGLQRLGVRSRLLYVPPAIIVWAGALIAGLHPTIAGVLVGLLTPVRAWLGPEGLLVEARSKIETLAGSDAISTREVAGLRQCVERLGRETVSPAEALIESLHPWVAFGIMPIFALANAAVVVPREPLSAESTGVFVAVVVGLVIGKPLGVVVALRSLLALGIARLPEGLSKQHSWVLGAVAGIGFTMSLFVAELALHEPSHLAAAKLGVLIASLLATLLSLGLGRALLREASPTPQSLHGADET